MERSLSQPHPELLEREVESTESLLSESDDVGYESLTPSISDNWRHSDASDIGSLEQVPAGPPRIRYCGRRVLKRRNRLAELGNLVGIKADEARDLDITELSDIFDESIKKSILSQCFVNPQLMKACKALLLLPNDEQMQVLAAAKLRHQVNKRPSSPGMKDNDTREVA
uniref:Uncharacterized protein n=1 Tax=Fundulus heteroclitus TaxID=8078 RepID=A0A146T1M2_FUNHE